MKNLLKSVFILGAIVLFGCDKDDSLKPLSFNEKVNEITSNTQFKPSLSDFTGKEWICTGWKLSFYSQVEMVGEWNAYKNTILEGEKNQLYKIDNNQLSVLKPEEVSGVLQNKIQKTSNSVWDDSGKLNIDDVKYTVKMQNDNLYLYFDTKDIVKVGKSFNVTVDNTYGNSLEQEGGVIGIGLIQFTKKELTQTSQESTDNVLSLINKFVKRDDILNQKFNIIETSSTDHTYTLSGGSDNNKHTVSLTDHQIDLTTIAPDRANLLFKAFVTKTVFKFKGVDLKINKIEHEDGSGSSFLVYGVTSQTTETVKFYYSTSSVKEHWLTAPRAATQASTDNVLSLINKFMNKDNILNQKFNIIETSSTDHTYTLSGGSDNNKHTVSLTDHQIDLTTIAPDRANLLFKAFVTKTVFKFKGVDLKINKIEHEDGSGSSFLVYGITSQTAEAVKFYYKTSSVKEHWLIAPQGTNTIDTKLIVGIWSHYREGGSLLTYETTTKYEYKADNSLIKTDLVRNVKETGTWSINADNTKLKIVLSKKINIATQETTDYNKTFEYDIVLLSNDEMNLRFDWLGHTITKYFSRV